MDVAMSVQTAAFHVKKIVEEQVPITVVVLIHHFVEAALPEILV